MLVHCSSETMTNKEQLARLSSSLTDATMDLSSRSLFIRSFRGIDDDGNEDEDQHRIEMEWDDPERGERQKCRPLSSFANNRLSNEVDDTPCVKKASTDTISILPSGPCISASKLMQRMGPFWHRFFLALAILGVLWVTVNFSLQKATENGKENNISFVSDETSNGNNANIFDVGQDDTDSTPELGDQDAVPSLTPVDAEEGTPQGADGDVPIVDSIPKVQTVSPSSNPESQTIDPAFNPEAQTLSPTTTGWVSPLPTSPPSSFPLIVSYAPTSAPTIYSSPSPSVVANPPVSSPSVNAPPPLDLPVSVPALPTSAPSGEFVVQPPPPTNPSPTSSMGSPSLGESVVLYSNESMEPGVFRASPNGLFQVGLTIDGDLVLMQQPFNKIIWSAGTSGAATERLFMQTDGNLLLRDGSGVTIWTTQTYGYPGARLVVDDAGQVAVKTEAIGTEPATTLWLHGIPRGAISYTSDAFQSASSNLAFPVRGAFYYP
jgi:hypothetical protein